MKKRKRVRGEAHVRLYRHELGCPAYRSLNANARALLVELRALFDVKRGDNCVFLSVREIMRRCNLGQTAAMRARDELVARGWIGIKERGHFQRKVRHATVFTLENEPPNSGNGSVPSKAFMRWQPSPERKNTVRIGDTQRYGSKIPRPEKMAVTVRIGDTDKPDFGRSSVSSIRTQISITKRRAA